MPTLAEQIIPRRKLLLMVSETVIFTVILLVGTAVPPLAVNPVEWGLESSEMWWFVASCAGIALVCQISLSYCDLYDWKLAQNRTDLPNRLLHAAGYALIMLALEALFIPKSVFQFPGLDQSPNGDETWKIVVLVVLGFVAIWTWRVAFHWFFYKWNFGERVLILGSGPQAHMISNLIQANRFAGFEIVGLVRLDGEPQPTPEENAAAPAGERVLGDAPDLLQIARQKRVARLVVALEERRGTLPVTELLDCKMAGIVIEEKEAMYERIAGKIAIQSLRPSYLIFGSGFGKHAVAAAAKRLIDIVFSLAGLILAAPLCILTAIAVKLDSRGPIFFTQERVGQDGVIFSVIKFRTMRADAEKHSGPVWAQTKDNRVTRTGRFLRITRIDEIPQMINVLAGHMSFVGPRPERQFFVDDLAKQIPFYPLRHTVKPGLTGWAQVNHHYGASVDDASEKLRYDLYYVKNMSPLFDLNIIMRTVGVILFGKGAR